MKLSLWLNLKYFLNIPEYSCIMMKLSLWLNLLTVLVMMCSPWTRTGGNLQVTCTPLCTPLFIYVPHVPQMGYKWGTKSSPPQWGWLWNQDGALVELDNKYIYFTTIFFSLSRRVFSISSSTLPSPEDSPGPLPCPLTISILRTAKTHN